MNYKKPEKLNCTDKTSTARYKLVKKNLNNINLLLQLLPDFSEMYLTWMCHKLVHINGNKHINALIHLGTIPIQDRCRPWLCILLNCLHFKTPSLLPAVYTLHLEKQEVPQLWCPVSLGLELYWNILGYYFNSIALSMLLYWPLHLGQPAGPISLFCRLLGCSSRACQWFCQVRR